MRTSIVGSVVSCLIAATVMSAAAQAPPASPDSAKPTRVFGVVTDSAGTPLLGAEIGVLEGPTFRAITGDSGRFVLTGLPAGTLVLTARRLGYEAATFTAVVKPGHTYSVHLTLTQVAQSLAGLSIEESRNPGHWLDVFESRRSVQRGTFITRPEIEDMQARTSSDLLRKVPGVQIVPGRMGPQVVMTRGAGARRCVPQYFIHQTPFSGTIDDIPPDDIEAIEVYVGISEIPSELSAGAKAMCAAVVIWTRAPPGRMKGL